MSQLLIGRKMEFQNIKDFNNQINWLNGLYTISLFDYNKKYFSKCYVKDSIINFAKIYYYGTQSRNEIYLDLTSSFDSNKVDE